MKITKLLSLLLLCLVFLSNGCNEDDENENLGVEGNCDAPRCYVSKYTETSYDGSNVNEAVDVYEYKTINGKKILDRITQDNGHIEFLYDNNNQLIAYKDYKLTGQLDSEYTISYTIDGKRSKTIETHYDDYYENGIGTIYTSEYSYNSVGKLKAIKEYEDGEYTRQYVIQSYNTEGQYSLISLYDQNDEIIHTFQLEYNNCDLNDNQKYVSNNLRENILFGRLIPLFPECNLSCLTSKITRQFSGISVSFNFEYDEQGLLKKFLVYDEDGEILSETEFEYECD